MIRIFTVEKKNDIWEAQDPDGTFFNKYGSYDAVVESISYDYYIHNSAFISDTLGVLAVEPHKLVSFNGWSISDIEDAALDMGFEMTEEQLISASEWLKHNFDASKGTSWEDIEEAVRIFGKEKREPR